MNIGHSSRLDYDKCAYDDYLSESVGPGIYRMNPHQIHNTNRCTSIYGPRASSHGVSTVVGGKKEIAPRQANIDIDSILSNRSILTSKCKDGNVNDIDVNEYRLQHVPQCNNFLDPVNSRLTNPSKNYRGMAINRFIDIPNNPQNVVFYDWAINSQLEAKDNFSPSIPKQIDQEAGMPRPKKQKNKHVIRYPCRNKKNKNICSYEIN